MFTVRTSFLPFKSYVLNIFVHFAFLAIKRKLKKNKASGVQKFFVIKLYLLI